MSLEFGRCLPRFFGHMFKTSIGKLWSPTKNLRNVNCQWVFIFQGCRSTLWRICDLDGRQSFWHSKCLGVAKPWRPAMPGGCGTPIDPSHELRASPTHAGGMLRLRNAGKGWMGESGEEIVGTVGRWGKCLTETSILSTDQQRYFLGQHPRIIPSLYTT